MKRKITIILSCILIVSLAVVIGTNITQKTKQPAEKQVVTGYPVWRAYTFETAIEEVATIVYGKVAGKSGTLMREVVDSSGKVHKEYYKEVEVQVNDLLKAEGSPKTITYLEMGGETDTHIYKIDGFNPVNDSDEYVFFLNKYDACLSPATVMSVDDGIVTVEKSMLPGGKVKNTTFTTIGVEEYVNKVKKHLESKDEFK